MREAFRASPPGTSGRSSSSSMSLTENTPISFMALYQSFRAAVSPRSSAIMLMRISSPASTWLWVSSFQVRSSSYWVTLGWRVPTTYSMAFCSLEP